jgi:hypothetical protein
MARGRFSDRDFGSAERNEYRGYRLHGGQRQAVALIDDSTALAGATESIRAAIDQEKAGGRPGSELLARARALPTPNQLWLVSKGTADVFGNQMPQDSNAAMLVKLLRSVTDLQAYADLRAGLTASASGQAPTNEDAKFLADTVRGLLGLARLSAPRDEPDLTRALDLVTLQQADRTITLAANIPAELADKLMERLRAFSEEGSRPPELNPRLR